MNPRCTPQGVGLIWYRLATSPPLFRSLSSTEVVPKMFVKFRSTDSRAHSKGSGASGRKPPLLVQSFNRPWIALMAMFLQVNREGKDSPPVAPWQEDRNRSRGFAGLVALSIRRGTTCPALL